MKTIIKQIANGQKPNAKRNSTRVDISYSQKGFSAIGLFLLGLVMLAVMNYAGLFDVPKSEVVDKTLYKAINNNAESAKSGLQINKVEIITPTPTDTPTPGPATPTQPVPTATPTISITPTPTPTIFGTPTPTQPVPTATPTKIPIE